MSRAIFICHSVKKIPLSPPLQRGKFKSKNHFPSLKKHALSVVERGQGDFGERSGSPVRPLVDLLTVVHQRYFDAGGAGECHEGSAVFTRSSDDLLDFL
jgi:hypothetical protein